MAKLKSVTQVGKNGSLEPRFNTEPKFRRGLKKMPIERMEYHPIEKKNLSKTHTPKRDNGLRPSATSGRDRNAMRANKAARANFG